MYKIRNLKFRHRQPATVPVSTKAKEMYILALHTKKLITKVKCHKVKI